MKKHFGWVRIAVAAFVVALSVTACNQASVDPVSTEPEALTSTYALVSAPLDFDDATVSNELRERPNPNLDPRGPKPMPHPFARLIKALNLTEEQAAQVREFLAAHDECAKAALSDLHAQMREILAAAKAARNEVMAKYRAGEITREEASAEIRAINQRTREALKNNDGRAKIKEAMKACDDEFLRSLNSILTPEQQEILKRFLEGKPTCGPSVGSRG